MRFYRGTNGWDTAADRAGKDPELVEIEPTKAGMLAFLKEHLPVVTPSDPPTLFDADGAPAPAAEAAGAGHCATNRPSDRCPNCGSARKEAQQLATAYFDQLTAAAVADKVMEFEGHKLANVLAAAVDRLRELEKRAKALPPEPQKESEHEPA